MYKFLSTALVSLSLVSFAGAGDLVVSKPAVEFYQTSVAGGWLIMGQTAIKPYAPVCSINRSYSDGSLFSILYDLNDGEVYIILTNIGWNITDKEGEYKLRANFHWSDGKIKGGNAPYDLLNKNTIRMRQLNSVFMKDFMDAKELRLIMPGTVENITITLTGSRDASFKLGDCIDASKKVNLKPKDQSRFPMGETL